jgi:hypothetical protein
MEDCELQATMAELDAQTEADPDNVAEVIAFEATEQPTGVSADGDR